MGSPHMYDKMHEPCKGSPHMYNVGTLKMSMTYGPPYLIWNAMVPHTYMECGNFAVESSPHVQYDLHAGTL